MAASEIRSASQLRAWLASAVKLALAGALIFWLIKSGKLDFSSLSKLMRPDIITISLVLVFLNVAIINERWRTLLKAQGFAVGYSQALRLTLIGLFFNFAIPGGVGGDVVKGYYVAKDNPSERLKSVMTIAVDRLVGLYMILSMALFSMTLQWSLVQEIPELKSIYSLLLTIFFFYSLGWAFVFSRRFHDSGIAQKICAYLPKGEKFLQLYLALSEYKKIKSVFFKTALLTIIGQSVAIGFFIFTGSFLETSPIPFSIYFFVVPIGFMITAIPISPAGIGVGQAAFYYLFNAALHFETPVGSSTVTFWQAMMFVISLIGAFFYIRSPKNQDKN
jgi:uncharacterized protein (TIRG00374 family)